MKYLVLAALVLGVLTSLGVQEASSFLMLAVVLLLVAAFFTGARRTTRGLLSFHRTMRRDGLW